MWSEDHVTRPWALFVFVSDFAEISDWIWEPYKVVYLLVAHPNVPKSLSCRHGYCHAIHARALPPPSFPLISGILTEWYNWDPEPDRPQLRSPQLVQVSQKHGLGNDKYSARRWNPENMSCGKICRVPGKTLHSCMIYVQLCMQALHKKHSDLLDFISKLCIMTSLLVCQQRASYACSNVISGISHFGLSDAHLCMRMHRQNRNKVL